MAYNERLAVRVRAALASSVAGSQTVEERKMFGGLAFMVNRHMSCGINGDRFMGRVGPQQYDDAVQRKRVVPMDFTGRPLTGMVYVEADGVKTRRQIDVWVRRCLRFVATLPPKTAANPRSRATAARKRRC